MEQLLCARHQSRFAKINIVPTFHGFYRLVGKADSQEHAQCAQINVKLIIEWDKCCNPSIIKGGFLWFNFVVVSQSDKHTPTDRSHFNIAKISVKVMKTRKDGEMIQPGGCRGMIIKCNVVPWLGSWNRKKTSVEKLANPNKV